MDTMEILEDLARHQRCPLCQARPIDARGDDLGAWRFNGTAWEHHHGYPVGHVPCVRIQEDAA